jgi:hypothetical protein
MYKPKSYLITSSHNGTLYREDGNLCGKKSGIYSGINIGMGKNTSGVLNFILYCSFYYSGELLICTLYSSFPLLNIINVFPLV